MAFSPGHCPGGVMLRSKFGLKRSIWRGEAFVFALADGAKIIAARA
tara:strand:- start:4033 stop:4170 length:138 start_codon:yes stop_codon:yes gene_type:complete